MAADAGRRTADQIQHVHEIALRWGFVHGRLLVTATATNHERVARGGWRSAETLPLCHGQEAWAPWPRATGYGPAALAWLHGHRVRSDLNPGDLRSDDVVGLWEDVLLACLERAFGTAALDRARERAGRVDHLVRVVVAPTEPVAARIPFEICRWPQDGGDAALGVSVVRLPVVLQPGVPLAAASLRGHEPGRYRATSLAGPRVAGDGDLDGLDAVMAKFASTSDLRATVVLPPLGEPFAADAGVLAEHVATTDLAVVVGHGTAGTGLKLEGEERLSSEQLVAAVGSGPTTAVFAVCGSAAPPDRPPSLQTASTAELASRGGLPIAIGFQGDEVGKRGARQFTASLLRAIRPALLAPQDEASRLIEWELATAGARADLKGGAFAPVCFLHPGLTGSPGAERPSPAQRRLRRIPSGTVRATCFVVPGQVAIFAGANEGVQLRLPLSVDAGADLRVGLGEGAGPASGGRSALDPEEVADVARAFGVPAGVPVAAMLEGASPDVRWAAHCAQLSALVRSLAHLLRRPVPPRVLALLEHAAAAEWGAFDGEARVLEVSTGRAVGRFERWPGLLVEREDVVVAGEPPKGPLPDGLLIAVPRDIRDAGVLDAKQLFDLMKEQSRRLETPPEGIPAAERDEEVVLPGRARVTEDDRLDGARTPQARERAVDVPRSVF